MAEFAPYLPGFIAAYAAGRRCIEAALGCFFTFATYKLATSEN